MPLQSIGSGKEFNVLFKKNSKLMNHKILLHSKIIHGLY